MYVVVLEGHTVSGGALCCSKDVQVKRGGK
jgi:hypothetical protein